MIPFCTLAEVKEWANVIGSTQDTILQALIERVSQNIRQFCSRDFDQIIYSDTYNGAGTSRFFLRNFPIVSVASVVINNINVPLAPNSNTYGFLFDANSVYLVGSPYGGGAGSFLPPAVFTRNFQNTVVTYTAGYLRNVLPTLDELPLDLRQACIEMVLLKYRRRLHAEKISETLAQQNTQYLTDEYTAEIRGVLNRYRRVTPV